MLPHPWKDIKEIKRKHNEELCGFVLSVWAHISARGRPTASQ